MPVAGWRHELSRSGDIARLVELPNRERPRERALNDGMHCLHDAELIALVLRTGTGRHDAVALGRSLLERFGDIHGLISQDARVLLRIAGLGEAKVAALLAIRELLKRVEIAPMRERRIVCDPEAARRYLGLHIGRMEREVFGLMLLNARHHLLAIEDVFLGTVDRSAVYSREVIKCCLRHNAASVVLFHNHPSGDPKPSPQDRKLTDRLTGILDEIDVQLVDHLVVAGMEMISLAELGWIESNYQAKKGSS